MNDTNRALNRLFVLIVGLVLLVAGGAVAVGALLPDVQSTVSQGASDAKGPTTDALSGGQPWILWVTAVVCLALIVLLAWFALRQGRGQTGTLLELSEGSRRDRPTGGHVVIDAKVAQQVLEEALAESGGIVSVDVTAFEVKKETVLRITANARRGVSPVDIRRDVDRAVAGWDDLLGTKTPVVIQINGGLRSQLSKASRLD